MNLRRISVSAALTAVTLLAVAACKDKPSDGPAAKPSAAAAASAAAPAGSASANTTSATTAAASSDMPLADFLGKIPTTACKALSECKNDKVKAVATMPVMLIAGFGTMDKPDLQKELEPVNSGMKQSKRWLPNDAECATLGGVALKVLGMQADTLEKKIGKTVNYDAKKGAACIESLAKAPAACGTEVKLATEPKMKDMDAMSKEVKSELDAYAKPCEEVFEGTVEAGGACEIDLECKGKDVKCKGPKGKPKACKAKG